MGLFGGRRKFDTSLSAEQEAAFRQWAGEKIRDTEDYDLRGAWLANAQAAGNGHLPDTYKKPNHPTFSDESQYSTPDQTGGTWGDAGDGSYNFWASPENLKHRSLMELVRYFSEVEPGNTMVAPVNWSMAPGRRR